MRFLILSLLNGEPTIRTLPTLSIRNVCIIEETGIFGHPIHLLFLDLLDYHFLQYSFIQQDLIDILPLDGIGSHSYFFSSFPIYR